MAEIDIEALDVLKSGFEEPLQELIDSLADPLIVPQLTLGEDVGDAGKSSDDSNWSTSGQEYTPEIGTTAVTDEDMDGVKTGSRAG